MSHSRIRPEAILATAWILVFWTACVAVPLGALVSRVQSWQALMDPTVIHIAGVTAGQALISALISAVLGIGLGLWVGASAGRREGRLAQALLALPFGVPTVVAGFAWVILLGRSGIFSGLDWAYSFKAVILAHVVFNVPWIALWVAQSRSFLPESRLEASRTLGAGAWAQFRWVIWPHIRWAFLSATCQSFVFCAMSFALILVLGGGPPVQTLEIALYSHIRYGSLDVSAAVACAIWELAITLLPWCLVIFFQSRDIHAFGRVTKDFGSQARGRRGMGFLQAAAAFLFFLPYLSVLTRQGHWSSDEIMPALKISLELAGVTAFGALLTALAAVVFLESLPSPWRGLRAVVTFLMGLPTGISVLVLGLGLWLAYGKWIDPFSGSFLAIAALQIVIFFPIAFRVLWPVARDRQVRLLEAATTLGASRVRAYWTVEWPRWKPPLVSALGMVAGASLGEVAAVSLFYSENLIPLPLLISRWSAQYRFADAQSVAVLLLFLCSGVILLAYPFAYPVKRTRK